MPGYRDPVRFRTRDFRVQRLTESAEALVLNGVSNRSWTEMGSDWLTTCSTPFSALWGFLKAAANESVNIVTDFSAKKVAEFVATAVGVWILGPVGGFVTGRISGAAIAGVSGLFAAIPSSVLDSAREALEDWAQDQQKDVVKSGGGFIANAASQRIFGTVSGCATLGEALPEIIQRLADKSAELAVRVAQYKSFTTELAANTKSLQYCDDALGLMAACYQLDALRAQVATDLGIVSSWVEGQRRFVDEIKLDQLRTNTLDPILKNFIDRPDVNHYTAYSWNLLSRRGQCSEAHCYGEGVA